MLVRGLAATPVDVLHGITAGPEADHSLAIAAARPAWISTRTGRSLRTRRSGSQPTALPPPTNTIYVANEFGGPVSVISGKSTTVAATIDVGRPGLWAAALAAALPAAARTTTVVPALVAGNTSAATVAAAGVRPIARWPMPACP
jgi:DNA-binding beta-propeller fold protein YncE